MIVGSDRTVKEQLIGVSEAEVSHNTGFGDQSTIRQGTQRTGQDFRNNNNSKFGSGAAFDKIDIREIRDLYPSI